MVKPTRSPAQELVGTLAGRLRFPWAFALLMVLFVADLLVPDPIPFVDELVLGLLTFLVGSWRTRRKVATDSSPALSDGGPGTPGPRR